MTNFSGAKPQKLYRNCHACLTARHAEKYLQSYRRACAERWANFRIDYSKKIIFWGGGGPRPRWV